MGKIHSIGLNPGLPGIPWDLIETPPPNVPETHAPQNNTITSKAYDDVRIPILYGPVRTGGVLIYRRIITTSINYGKLLCVYLLGWGPINSVSNIRFGQYTSLSGIQTEIHTGSTTSNATVSTLLNNYSCPLNPTVNPEWTSRLPGLAYVVCIFDANYNGATPPNPDDFNCDIQGLLVRDHRLDPTLVTRYYSDNVALCRADFWTSSRFAGGRKDNDVDWTTIDTAANACDALIGLPQITAALGGAGVAIGTFQYSYSVVDNLGKESELAAVSLSITSAANVVNLTVPISTRPNIVSRNIYRNDAGNPGITGWRKIGSIADNVTTTFSDNVNHTVWVTDTIAPSLPVYTGKRFVLSLKMEESRPFEDWDKEFKLYANMFDGYYNGKHQMFVDVAQSTSTVVLTDVDGTTTANIRSAVLRDKNTQEIPDRYVTDYVDALNDYKPGTAQTENVGISTGAITDPVIIKSNTPGNPTFDQAKRISVYRYNVGQVDKEADIYTLFDGGVYCVPGLVITVTSSDCDWTNQLCLVLSVEDDSDIGFKITVRPYNTNIYSDAIQTTVSVTQNPGDTSNTPLAAPTGLTVVEVIPDVTQGVFVPSLQLSWTKNPLARCASTNIKMQVAGGAIVDKGNFSGNGPVLFTVMEGFNKTVTFTLASVEQNGGTSNITVTTNFTTLPPPVSERPVFNVGNVSGGVALMGSAAIVDITDNPPHPMVVSFLPAQTRTRTHYGATSWSTTGTLNNGAAINDGATNVTGVTLTASGQTITLDFGSAKTPREFLISYTSPVHITGEPNVVGGIGSIVSPQIFFSDDGITFRAIAYGFVSGENTNSCDIGWIPLSNHGITGTLVTFSPGASHRYWKIEFNTGSIIYPVAISEIQAFEYTGAAPYIHHYNIYDTSNGITPPVLLASIPATQDMVANPFYISSTNVKHSTGTNYYASIRVTSVDVFGVESDPIDGCRPFSYGLGTQSSAATWAGTETLSNKTIDGSNVGTTPSLVDNSTLLATTAFVKGQGYITTAPVTSVAGKTGAVTLVEGDVGSLVADLAAKAPLASPTFTGDPKAPTPLTADNDTSIATTAFVKAQGYITSAPVASVAGKTGAVTLVEGDIGSLVTDLAAKAPLASPVFTGDPQAPTPATGDNDTSIATTAFVQASGLQVAYKSADQVNALGTGAFVSDSVLTFAAAAGKAYYIDAYIIWTSSVTTNGGPQIGVSTPASPTLTDFLIEIQSSISGGTDSFTQIHGAATFGIASAASAVVGLYARIRGVFINGANAGTFAVQFASDFNNGTSITVKAGSHLTWKQLN